MFRYLVVLPVKCGAILLFSGGVLYCAVGGPRVFPNNRACGKALRHPLCAGKEDAVLNAGLVSSLLTEASRITLLVRDTVTSTNLLVKELGAQGAPEGTLMVASEQTQGRGRLGRRFESPEHTGLYFTILLRPDLPVSKSLHITILAAVAAAEGIAAVTGLSPEIKWVNDLYLRDRKICGILAESAFLPGTDRLAYTALGIGVNLEEPAGGFTGTAAGIAGALYPHGAAPEELPERLLAAIVNRLLGYFDELREYSSGESEAERGGCGAGARRSDFPHGNAPSYMERYRASDYLFGKDVWLVPDITRPEAAQRVQATAIDAEGRLLVTLPDGTTEAVSSGDVMIRLS